MKNIVERSIMMAFLFHDGQKYGKDPYFMHLWDVWNKGMNNFGDEFDETCQAAAYLHDIFEDTPVTADFLRRQRIPDDVIEIVELVTKDENLTYFENIDRIIKSGNRRAMMVKYSDNTANLFGDKSHWNEARAKRSNDKYSKSRDMIMAALQD